MGVKEEFKRAQEEYRARQEEYRQIRTPAYLFKRDVFLRPNNEFLIDWVSGKGERRLTYKQVAEDVYRLCWGLKNIGVSKGDVAAIIGYNTVESMEVVLGASLIGLVFSCQNPDLPEDWLVTIVEERANSKVIFFEERYREKVKGLMSRLKSATHFISLDGPSGDNILGYKDFISKYEPKDVEIEVSPDDINQLPMTSGTTGVPKACIFTNEAVWWNALEAAYCFEVGPEDVGAYLAPNFWSVWIGWDLWDAVWAGSSVVVLDGRLDLDLFCEAVTKERINYGIIPGFVWLEIASWPEERWRKYDLGSLKRPGVWGLTVPLSVFQTMYDRWRIVTIKVYACAEAVCTTIASDLTCEKLLLAKKEEQLASWGFPAPFAIWRVVDAEGRDVSVGEVGEMIVKGPDVSCGYAGQLDKTAAVFKEGWFYTGNMVRKTEDGYMFLEGKKEDLGIFPKDKSGKFVMPYAMQAAVTGVPEVVESSAITVSDPDYGSKFVLVVRPKEGITFSKERVIETASKYVPGYLIKDVILRKEPLPKTPTGKIIVRDLAKEYNAIIPEA